MTMPPDAAQRLRDEQNDLAAKLGKLDAFISISPVFHMLDLRDQELLCEQQKAMAVYFNILTARIERF